MAERKKEEEELKEIQEFMELAAGGVNHKLFLDSLIASGFSENQAMKQIGYIFWVHFNEALEEGADA